MHQHATTSALAALILVLGLGAAPAHATIHLSFGLYTSNKPTAMVKQFRPVLDILQSQMTELLGTPVKIRIQVAKDYSQGIDHLASGKVDFSRFGPASYIEAKRVNAGLRILAMERVRGDKVFYGIIAVAKSSPIRAISQLRGKSFAFGNDQSTIGRYLSQLYLRNHGIFSADLSRYDYLGRHDTVGTAVGAGHFDAGALNEATFSKLVAKGTPIRELARFPNVTKPWIAREGLPEKVYLALRDALLATNDPVVNASLKADGFVPGDDADYEEIRIAIEMNDKFFEAPSALAASRPIEGMPVIGGDGDGAAPPAAGRGDAGGWSEADVDVPGVRPLRPGIAWGEADFDTATAPASSESRDAVAAPRPSGLPVDEQADELAGPPAAGEGITPFARFPATTVVQ